MQLTMRLGLRILGVCLAFAGMPPLEAQEAVRPGSGSDATGGLTLRHPKQQKFQADYITDLQARADRDGKSPAERTAILRRGLNELAAWHSSLLTGRPMARQGSWRDLERMPVIKGIRVPDGPQIPGVLPIDHDRRIQWLVSNQLMRLERRGLAGPHLMIFDGKPTWNDTTKQDRFTTTVGFWKPGAKPQRPLCSGTLLTPRHVLTAGHCLCGLGADEGAEAYVEASRIMTFEKSTSVRVASGVPQPHASQESYCTRYRANVDASGRPMPLPGLDIAVLTLAAAVPKAQLGDPEYRTWSNIWPKGRRGEEPDNAYIAGFGKTHDQDQGNRERHLAILGWNELDCSHCVSGAEVALADLSVLDPAHRQPGPDTCQGDSGGPLHAFFGYQRYLIGITSRDHSGLGCGWGGVYALLTDDVVEWINKQIGK